MDSAESALQAVNQFVASRWEYLTFGIDAVGCEPPESIRLVRDHLELPGVPCEVYSGEVCFGDHGNIRVLVHRPIPDRFYWLVEERNENELSQMCGMGIRNTDGVPDEARRLFVAWAKSVGAFVGLKAIKLQPSKVSA